MNLNIRDWLVWLLPFTLCFGILCGALGSIALLFDTPVAGEAVVGSRGAAGTMAVVISPLVGFPAAMFTVVISRIAGRPSPDSVVKSLGPSVFGGAVLGGSAAVIPPEHFILTWLLLVLGSSVVTWFCLG